MIGGFPVVILAGGEGRRIGGGKPLRGLGGETLIERSVRRARQWSGDVLVAVRHKDQPGAHVCASIADDPDIAGPLGGLASALRHARDRSAQAVLTVPCDTPFLPPDLDERLAGALGGAAVAIAESGGRLHPACALWRIRAFDCLCDFVSTGRRSLRGFAEHVGHATAHWPVEPFDPFFNVNDETQLRQAEAMLREIRGSEPKSR